MSAPAPLGWTFGQMEGVLAKLHDVADGQRTKFQARLKNFHRLGYPAGFEMRQGRAAIYGAGDVVAMALVVELTQLGLNPERAVRVMDTSRFSTFMAVGAAARAIRKSLENQNEAGAVASITVRHLEVENFYLFFDPRALAPMTNGWIDGDEPPQVIYDDRYEPKLNAPSALLFGRIAELNAHLEKTAWDGGRLALINVTTLVAKLATFAAPQTTDVDKIAFLKEATRWIANAGDPNIALTLAFFIENGVVPAKEVTDLVDAGDERAIESAIEWYAVRLSEDIGADLGEARARVRRQFDQMIELTKSVGAYVAQGGHSNDHPEA